MDENQNGSSKQVAAEHSIQIECSQRCHHARTCYVCPICSKEVRTRFSFYRHLDTVHDKKYQWRKKYKCEPCSKVFTTLLDLRFHIRKHHFNLKAKQPIHVKKKLLETWIEPILNSETCVQMTKKSNNVLIIKKIGYVDDKKFATEGSVTDLSEQFPTNKRKYTDKLICDYCKKRMVRKSLIKHIKEVHSNVRNYHCVECGRRFHRPYQLKKHECQTQTRKRYTKKKWHKFNDFPTTFLKYVDYDPLTNISDSDSDCVIDEGNT